MLLAKVLDRLFNRRNSFEIESLEGDVDINDVSLKEVVDYVSSIKEYIKFNNEDVAIDIYNNLYVQDDLSVDGDLKISAIEGFLNADGEPFFPNLLDQAGKFVKVKSDETGFEYGEVSGGTQLYRHQIQLPYTKSGVTYKCLLIIICSKSTNFQDLNELKGYYNGLYVGVHSNSSIVDVDVSNGAFALVSISNNNVTVGDSNVSYTVASISSDTVSSL